MRFHLFTNIFIGFILFSCGQETNYSKSNTTIAGNSLTQKDLQTKNKPGVRAIHVFVALCDNKYQGIVPVPAKIGNGQDPANNLYWGAAYGIKTFFSKKNSEWQLLKSEKNISDTILERILLKHKTQNVFLLADAYNGKFIKQATIDFLNTLSGETQNIFIHNADTILFGGKADFVAYTGHNGLMDFSLTNKFVNKGNAKKDAIILACYSKNYFSQFLISVKANPLVWSTGLMAPEAYILHDAVSSWVKKESAEQIRNKAAEAYSRYQKCNIKAAKNLLVTGY